MNENIQHETPVQRFVRDLLTKFDDYDFTRKSPDVFFDELKAMAHNKNLKFSPDEQEYILHRLAKQHERQQANIPLAMLCVISFAFWREERAMSPELGRLAKDLIMQSCKEATPVPLDDHLLDSVVQFLNFQIKNLIGPYDPAYKTRIVDLFCKSHGYVKAPI